MQPKRSALIGRKSGVSEVVATVIIIALVVVAVAVVWVGASPLVKNKIGDSDVCNSVDVSIENSQGYTCYQPNNITMVQIKKGASDVNVSGLKFLLSSGGNSVQYVKEDVLGKNSYNTFYFNSFLFSKLNKIEVVPVVVSGKTSKDCASIFIDDVKVCGSTIKPEEIVQAGGGGGGILNEEGMYWGYQEFANTTTVVNTNPTNGYVEEEYIKPVGTKTMIWQVRHGTFAQQAYNITNIPANCSSQSTFKVRLYSSFDSASSSGACYDGSGWITITNIYSGGGTFLQQSIDVRGNMYDGDWNTGAVIDYGKWENSANGNSGQGIGGDWQEDAVWWYIVN